jgi:murein L,D-transpeptidase YafK
MSVEVLPSDDAVAARVRGFGPLGVAARRAMVALVPLSVVLAYESCGLERRFSGPSVALAAARTHAEVLRHIGPKLRPALQEQVEAVGLRFPPSRLVIVGLKQERVLEVWAGAGAGWKRIRSYAILAASGRSGPKRREGDLQVPEGVYRLTGFNPNSGYHLSLRVDYPNAFDRAAARTEGRTRLGGDIYIHGRAVSIGCIALGDAAIEELYLLVAEVGLARTKVVLSPSAAPIAPPESPEWVERLYDRLRRELRATRAP